MSKGPYRLLLSIGILAALRAPLSGQGFYWETTSAGAGVEDSTAVTETYYLPGECRVVPPAPEPELIVRLGERTVTVVNTSAKTYTVMSFAEWSATVGEQKPRMFSVPPSIQNLPPEERQRALDELYQNAPFQRTPQVDVLKSTEMKTIKGLPCVKTIVREDGKPIGSVWSTPMIKGVEVLLSELPSIAVQLTKGKPALDRSMAEALKYVPGFPVETEAGGTTTTLKMIEPRNLDESVFEPDPGFRKARAQPAR